MKYILIILIALIGWSSSAAYQRTIERDRLEVRSAVSCQSGWAVKGSEWKYWYCAKNEDPEQNIYEAFFFSCFRYEGTGSGNGIVTIYNARDAIWRIGSPVCLPTVCDNDPSAKCLVF